MLLTPRNLVSPPAISSWHRLVASVLRQSVAWLPAWLVDKLSMPMCQVLIRLAAPSSFLKHWQRVQRRVTLEHMEPAIISTSGRPCQLLQAQQSSNRTCTVAPRVARSLPNRKIQLHLRWELAKKNKKNYFSGGRYS